MPPVHVTADQVTNFLRSHPDFLERFVMEEVELEQLERWIIRRSQRLKKKPEASSKNSRKTSLSRWKFCVHADKRQMLQDLTYSLQLKPTKDHVLWELATCISSAVGADGFRLYLPDRSSSDKLSLYQGPESKIDAAEKTIIQKLKSGVSVPAYVARTLEPVHLSRNEADPRFPDAIPDEEKSKGKSCNYEEREDKRHHRKKARASLGLCWPRRSNGTQQERPPVFLEGITRRSRSKRAHAAMARSKKDLQYSLKALLEEAEVKELKINQNKTKAMICTREKSPVQRKMKTGTLEYEVVDNVKYLGVVIKRDSNSSMVVENLRIMRIKVIQQKLPDPE
ncbi:hypothetical protein QE152_g27319 [Popillia japonica]|uniref:Uncharacterized protein n=1 Tax=Popillia japonica TaxID=7064 RepID=A0AAW1JWR8_POPJA